MRLQDGRSEKSGNRATVQRPGRPACMCKLKDILIRMLKSNPRYIGNAGKILPSALNSAHSGRIFFRIPRTGVGFPTYVSHAFYFMCDKICTTYLLSRDINLSSILFVLLGLSQPTNLRPFIHSSVTGICFPLEHIS